MELITFRFMKRLLALAIFAVAFLSGSCYDDYVKDHDHTSIYIAYQYDLRTFVVGEGMNFDVGAVLGGVIAGCVFRWPRSC